MGILYTLPKEIIPNIIVNLDIKSTRALKITNSVIEKDAKETALALINTILLKIQKNMTTDEDHIKFMFCSVCVFQSQLLPNAFLFNLGMKYGHYNIVNEFCNTEPIVVDAFKEMCLKAVSSKKHYATMTSFLNVKLSHENQIMLQNVLFFIEQKYEQMHLTIKNISFYIQLACIVYSNDKTILAQIIKTLIICSKDNTTLLDIINNLTIENYNEHTIFLTYLAKAEILTTEIFQQMVKKYDTSLLNIIAINVPTDILSQIHYDEDNSKLVKSMRLINNGITYNDFIELGYEITELMVVFVNWQTVHESIIPYLLTLDFYFNKNAYIEQIISHGRYNLFDCILKSLPDKIPRLDFHTGYYLSRYHLAFLYYNMCISGLKVLEKLGSKTNATNLIMAYDDLGIKYI